MLKRISKKIAIVLAMTMILTSFAIVMPVNAASKPDLKKANVKWDLRNNKELKFKTKWSIIGVKKHTVKMTNFKITNAKKKGYKKCTFTLTYKLKINPTKKQVREMAALMSEPNIDGEYSFGGNYYFTVVDYKTGKSLERKNDKNVKVTSSGWKYSDYHKMTTKDGSWIRYAKKATVNVTIVYPKKYKNLAIGVGGHTDAPSYYSEINSGGGDGIGVASASGYITNPNANKYWKGKRTFSEEKLLWSKKDSSFAHFMRVKN